MSRRGRSISPRPLTDGDVDMINGIEQGVSDAKVVIVTNLTRNIVESHLQTIFGFYGEMVKVDLPLYGKSGQNRGKAAVEYVDALAAQKAMSHMNGSQLDGSILKVELSNLPVHSRSRSPLPRSRNGRDVPKSLSRSRSRSPRGPLRRRGGYEPRFADSYRGRGSYGRRGPPPVLDSYRPHTPSRSRSRSPIRRIAARVGPRRKSPSYERGGTGYRARRSRSKTYSVRSSRSRSRSFTHSRSRSRSYSSYSRYSRSRSRSRSYSRGRRSRSRDDIRDSRSRSPRGDM